MRQIVRSPLENPGQDRKALPHHSARVSPAGQYVEPSLQSPEGVLQLQRMIGNRAVTRMIGRSRTSAKPVVQRAVKAKLTTEPASADFTDLNSLCAKFGIKKKDLVAPIKTALFQGNLFPASYKASYDANPHLQDEMSKIVIALDDLVTASESATIIDAAKGDANAVGTQLFAIIGAGIDAVRLNQYVHYKTATTLGANMGEVTSILSTPLLENLLLTRRRLQNTIIVKNRK